MQQFTPFFPGYESQQQPQQQTQQQQNGQSQDQQQQQQQQPLAMNGQNLAIYSPAAMQPLSVLAAAQRKEQQQHQQVQQVQQQQIVPSPTMSDMGAHGKPKRKQVKNACVNCQKACKKCDIGRPCQRCIKYGLTDTCINSVRKERKKGVKRGPYKKRNKSGGESATSSGASTPNMASTMANTNLYAQNAGVRPNAMPMHYQPFPTQGHYDPYAYANSSQMMPQAYMVPAAIQQMYPTNPPVLSYQAAMNMISPQQQQQQQQQQQPQSGAYRLQEQLQQQSPTTNTSATSTPTLATATATTTTTTTTTTVAGGEDGTTKTEDDDEGSKLNMLSRLCSAVLDGNDAAKTEGGEVKTEEAHQNTPPPSRPHSREPSQDTNNNNNEVVGSTGPNFGNDSPHTYVNGHLAHRVNNIAYGTPGTSPSDSPVDTLNFNKVVDNSGQWSQATHEQQFQQQDHNQS